MEEVFDFREFVLSLLKRIKGILISAIIFGLLGGGYGFLTAGTVGEGGETFTATCAASVNVDDSGTITQWTPGSVMGYIDALTASDFVYAEFGDVLVQNGLGEVVGNTEEPTAADVQLAVKFYTKGNLLLADITTDSEEHSRQASEVALDYLATSFPKLLNHITVTPQGRQTINIVEMPAPSRVKRGLKYGLLGTAGGIVLGFLGSFFFDVFDLKLRSERDLKKFGIPVLGVVPRKGGKQE